MSGGVISRPGHDQPTQPRRAANINSPAKGEGMRTFAVWTVRRASTEQHHSMQSIHGSSPPVPGPSSGPCPTRVFRLRNSAGDLCCVCPALQLWDTTLDKSHPAEKEWQNQESQAAETRNTRSRSLRQAGGCVDAYVCVWVRCGCGCGRARPSPSIHPFSGIYCCVLLAHGFHQCFVPILEPPSIPRNERTNDRKPHKALTAPTLHPTPTNPPAPQTPSARRDGTAGRATPFRVCLPALEHNLRDRRRWPHQHPALAAANCIHTHHGFAGRASQLRPISNSPRCVPKWARGALCAERVAEGPASEATSPACPASSPSPSSVCSGPPSCPSACLAWPGPRLSCPALSCPSLQRWRGVPRYSAFALMGNDDLAVMSRSRQQHQQEEREQEEKEQHQQERRPCHSRCCRRYRRQFPKGCGARRARD